jgi:putative membrane protein
MMFHGYYYGWGIWPMLAGGVLFWGSIVALIAWAVHRTTRHVDRPYGTTKSALDYAKDRYARGEISKEEFDQIKRDLQS